MHPLFAHIIRLNIAFPNGPVAHSPTPWSINSSYCRKNSGLTGSQCSKLSEVWKQGQLWTLSQMDRTAEHSRNEWLGPNYSDRKLPK